MENQSTISHKDFTTYCDQSDIIIYVCYDENELSLCVKLVQNGPSEVKIGKTREQEYFYSLFLNKNHKEKILLVKFDEKSTIEGAFTLPYEWYPLLMNLIKSSEYYNELNNENFSLFRKFLKSHFKRDFYKFIQKYLESSSSDETGILM